MAVGKKSSTKADRCFITEPYVLMIAACLLYLPLGLIAVFVKIQTLFDFPLGPKMSGNVPRLRSRDTTHRTALVCDLQLAVAAPPSVT